MTFWCRRWMEHSRAPAASVNRPSPRICTSTWRGRSKYRSRYTASFPNEARARSAHARNAFISSCSSRATCIPIPPPPAAAFTSSGYPSDDAAAFAPTSSPTCPSEPGTTGTPAARITERACALSLIARIAPGGGPTNTMPACAQASANSACSERKP